ncbi:MAG TPA: CDP-alcohol phosphatidyltransferase family protein [Myxococcota bacterium]|nr:CDP-alcohol phosphatidyltransferase family protein [Myxococcota bacterium]
MADDRTPTGAGLVTWANALTLARLASAPALAWALVEERAFVALALFAAACASDFADGGLARRLGQVSSLGGLLDHATDATLMVVGLAALSVRGLVPALLPVLVAAAFVQYVVDSRAAAGRPLRPNPIGRWNGIAYYVLLGTPIVRDAAGVLWPWDTLVAFAGWVLVASTALSMVQRFRRRPA